MRSFDYIFVVYQCTMMGIMILLAVILAPIWIPVFVAMKFFDWKKARVRSGG